MIGGIFFLARYWRRTEASTEVEFVRLRYGDNSASKALRCFKVISDGILVNCTIMAAVTMAMAKIAKIVLGLSDETLFTLPIFGEITPTIAILFTLTIFVLLYSAMSGLYGVVYTDLFQFIFAMIGTVALAIIMYFDASNREGGMLAALRASPDFKEGMLDMIPNLSQWSIGTMLFIVYVGFLWVMNFPTGGFHVQRLLSTKNEQEATKAFMWFNFANFVLRSWPWIIVGMLAMIYFPNLENPEDSYAMAIDKFLPVGLKGLMVASFLAAYMSTISTHLNWGTSYVVHDLYEGFINPNAKRKKILFLSRSCMVFFLVFAAIIAAKLPRMIDAYNMLFQVWAGMGFILVARWYWWRVTAGAEFFCLLTTIFLVVILNIKVGDGENTRFLCQGLFDWGINILNFDPNHELIAWAFFAIRVFLVTFIPLLFWVPYVLLTTDEPSEAALSFHRKMRLSSIGWKRAELITGVFSPRGEFKNNLKAWLCSVGALYGIMLGIGSIIFQQWNQALIYMPIGLIGAYFTWKIMSSSSFDSMREYDLETLPMLKSKFNRNSEFVK
jgi:SSS family solute:Na+ symporter